MLPATPMACDRAPAGAARAPDADGSDPGRSLRARDDARRAAEQYLEAGRFDEALVISRRLVDVAPDGATERELHARILLAVGLASQGPERSERLARAADAYAEAVRTDPDNPGLQHAAGVAFDQAGRLEDARARYERAAALDPSNAQYALYLGMALRRLGALEEALRSLDRAHELAPDAAPILVARADARLAAGRAEEALADAGRARTLAPGDLAARVAEARAFRATGQSLRAAESLAALDERARSDEAVAQELATALVEVGRPEDAARAWERSLAADPRRWLSALGAAEAWLLAGDLIRADERASLAAAIAPRRVREERVQPVADRIRAASAARDQRSDRPPSTGR